jgi:hypothetical protein
MGDSPPLAGDQDTMRISIPSGPIRRISCIIVLDLMISLFTRKGPFSTSSKGIVAFRLHDRDMLLYNRFFSNSILWYFIMV